MTKEKTGKERGAGPFQLLRRCHEVESRLGRLYESRNVRTGRPALTLFPHDSVEWQPMGPWRGWLYFEPGPDCVSMELEHQPDTRSAMDWVNVLSLLEVVGQRVEDSPEVKDHLSGQPLHGLARWLLLARWWLGSRGGWAFASLALLALGLGVCLGRVSRPPESANSGMVLEGAFLASAPERASLEESTPQNVSYPLPSRPWGDQAVPPCETRKGAVEINKGCWVELAKTPPCFDTQAEHQGKCYLPVAKKDAQKPQAAKQ